MNYFLKSFFFLGIYIANVRSGSKVLFQSDMCKKTGQGKIFAIQANFGQKRLSSKPPVVELMMSNNQPLIRWTFVYSDQALHYYFLTRKLFVESYKKFLVSNKTFCPLEMNISSSLIDFI